MLNFHKVTLYPSFTVKINGIFANYLRTMFSSVFCLKGWVWMNIFDHAILPSKIQISKPIDVPYGRVYFLFKDDKYVICMWIWLILKNISLLDRIWSLWFVRFGHSPTSFIFWLDRLIFSVSINSHPDIIYILDNFMKKKRKHHYDCLSTCHDSIHKISNDGIKYGFDNRCNLAFLKTFFK